MTDFLFSSGTISPVLSGVETDPLRQSSSKLYPKPIGLSDTQQSINQHTKYQSYSGVDIVATLLIPCEPAPLTLGELSTLSYSIHRENRPVRILGKPGVIGWGRGARTIAGSMIFTNFDEYAFYRLKRWQTAIANGIYPVADMLPPFDIVLSFANEYGQASRMKIFGCNIIDEGGTMSVDDLVTESTYTFMARGIQPMLRNHNSPRRVSEEAMNIPVVSFGGK